MSEALSVVLASSASLFAVAALLGVGALGAVVTLGLGLVWMTVRIYSLMTEG